MIRAAAQIKFGLLQALRAADFGHLVLRKCTYSFCGRFPNIVFKCHHFREKNKSQMGPNHHQTYIHRNEWLNKTDLHQSAPQIKENVVLGAPSPFKPQAAGRSKPTTCHRFSRTSNGNQILLAPPQNPHLIIFSRVKLVPCGIKSLALANFCTMMQ